MRTGRDAAQAAQVANQIKGATGGRGGVLIGFTIFEIAYLPYIRTRVNLLEAGLFPLCDIH